MGSAFVLLFLTFTYQLIIYIVNRAFQTLDFKIKWVERHEKEAFFNMTFRVMFEGCIEFLICGIINVFSVRLLDILNFVV
jgi:hypothetical protein